MKSARDRIEWLVAFAGKDLATMRAGDWLNLRDDVGAFLGTTSGGATLADLGGLPIIMPIAPPAPKDLSDVALRELQSEIRTLLDGLVGPLRQHPRQHAVTWTGLMAGVKVETSYTLLGHHSLGALLTASGRPRDMVLLRAIMLLTREDTQRLGRCPEPECGKLFFRVRRQKYCGRACVNRANKRAWRAGLSARRTRKPRTRKVRTRDRRNVPASTGKRPRSTPRHPTTKRKTPR